MNPIRWAKLRLRALFGRRALERDMTAEMAEHLELATERYIARGMSPVDARRAALREFGNVAVLQEQARDARGSRWLDALAGDLHFALRYFGRHSGSTVLIVAVLAIGTGMNAALFSMLQSQFLRPAPAVPEDAAHARIWAQERPSRTAGWQPRGFTQPELAALAERNDVFESITAWAGSEVVLGGRDSTAATAVGAQYVTPNYFGALGVDLAAGAGFRQTQDEASGVTAVLAYGLAEFLYGRAADAVGRQILVNDVPVHVVGVAPARFQGALRNMGNPGLWLPLSARTELEGLSHRWLLDEPTLSLVARLAPGASREQATSVAQIAVARTLPDSAGRVGMARTATVLPMHGIPPGPEKSAAVFAFTVVLIIGLLILLVACMNVSSLMVAAALGRRHEIAVRLALGASRIRVLRQLLTESTLLALLGGALGFALAWWSISAAQNTEIGLDLRPDFGTFAYVLLIVLATGVLFGLSPALHATRSSVSGALRDSGKGASSRSRLQRGFVIAQIALSMPLLLMLGALMSMMITGEEPLSPDTSRRVISVAFNPVSRAGEQSAGAVETLIARIAERPEVLSVVPASEVFATRGIVTSDRRIRVPDGEQPPSMVHLEGAAPGWFAALDVPIVQGRDVTLPDTAAPDYPVVIGSDLARAIWGSANPIGRTLASPALAGSEQDSLAMTVVGVYDATRPLPEMTGAEGGAGADVVYRAFTARGKHWQPDQILVRTRGPALPYLRELQPFVRAHAPSLPVTSIMTLAQLDEQEYRQMLKQALLAGAAGAVALLLASLGLYGVVSLAVRQRRREIGIRIAVGGHPREVARMFLASGMRAGLAALALGLPISVFALKLGVAQGVVNDPNSDPYLIGAIIALLLLAVAAVATWLPARRAAQVDPALTLRVE